MGMILHEDYVGIAKDEKLVEQIVTQVLAKGFYEVPHFLNGELFEKLQSIAKNSIQTIANKKNEELKNTDGYQIVLSEDIFSLCDAIHKKRCEMTKEKYVPLRREKQTIGFPYKDARNFKKTEETEYHYDGAYVNLLVPILLPLEDTTKGNLILFPNLRKKFSVKVFTSILSEILRWSKIARTLFGFTEVQYTPGNLYIFFGDVSLHGVQPITVGERLVLTINSHW